MGLLVKAKQKRTNENREKQQCCAGKHTAIHNAFQMDTQIKEIIEGIACRICTYYLNEWLETCFVAHFATSMQKNGCVSWQRWWLGA